MKRIRPCIYLLFGMLCFVSLAAQEDSPAKLLVKEGSVNELRIDSPVNLSILNGLDNHYDYAKIQGKLNRFKENGVTFQYLNKGEVDRMWFATSRPDELYLQSSITKLYQQIWFSERVVGNGKMPKEGWNSARRWMHHDESKTSWCKDFNEASKGAPTVAHGTMIFSCDQFSSTETTFNKDLWIAQLEGNDLPSNPHLIPELANEATWESQPTLSHDGKHLFFVSNRYVSFEDYTIDITKESDDLNLFYSFFNGEVWSEPRLVAEISTRSKETCPSLSPDGKTLYYVANYDGSDNVYERGIELSDRGGYALDNKVKQLFKSNLFYVESDTIRSFNVNSEYNQTYPCVYYNARNNRCPHAMYWSCNDSLKQVDIYGCNFPIPIEYHVAIAFEDEKQLITQEYLPSIHIEGYKTDISVSGAECKATLYTGLLYKIEGALDAIPLQSEYKYEGFQVSRLSGFVGAKPSQKQGTAYSEFSNRNGLICPSLNTTHDLIFFQKQWEFDHLQPTQTNFQLEQYKSSISYFQSGFWEVNTSVNLERDLKKLHNGFTFNEEGTQNNPARGINRQLSDYEPHQGSAKFPIDKTDTEHTYSIANARWIELHPNNFYWGDRPEYSYMNTWRMIGRKERIAQYRAYAKQVDENLSRFGKQFVNDYLKIFDTFKSDQDQLIIEMVAVSDKRQVGRGWYIGETVQYRDTRLQGKDNTLITEQVVIVAPTVNEQEKRIEECLPCSIELNEQGNNGSHLGKEGQYHDRNTNLSRLRAWYGYKEILKELMKHPLFEQYINEGKVALPNNKVDYNQAEIVVLIHGEREDAPTGKLNDPYPEANNPNTIGDYGYDKQRRLEMGIRLIQKNDLIQKQAPIASSFE